ncbi:MAG: hypothetical protein DI586_02545 [Micavibrio aeruginosavorus]|uniref:Uncharacterized protein n=1 Tax=Micavibrio aeruginosavorus TaxID=349221 RepID=A0A2W5HMC6_9BACT|nr:MAG: hypothetical protein DI586_02545 [Micavibrio aeruginosavorus]
MKKASEIFLAAARGLSVSEFQHELDSAISVADDFFYAETSLEETAAGKLILCHHDNSEVQGLFLQTIQDARELGRSETAFQLSTLPLMLIDKLNSNFREKLVGHLAEIGAEGNKDFYWPVKYLSLMDDVEYINIDQAVMLLNICAEKDMSQAVELAIETNLYKDPCINSDITALSAAKIKQDRDSCFMMEFLTYQRIENGSKRMSIEHDKGCGLRVQFI